MTHGSLAHWAEWVLPWVVMDGNESRATPSVRAVRRMVLGIDERIDGVNLGELAGAGEMDGSETVHPQRRRR